jgi:prepilin-type N-terminal cleavage/methylation domain-containing protein
VMFKNWFKALKNPKKQKEKGFTLVELLIVITLIGVLAGVTASVVNSNQQRKRVEDAAKRANMEKIYSGLEGYFSAEGRYPSGSDDPSLAYYMIWPHNEPKGAVYHYTYNDGSPFVYVILSTNDEAIYKYFTGWGVIKECHAPEDRTNPDSCTEPPEDDDIIPPPPPPGYYALSVTEVEPDTGGKVVSEPDGIDCGAGASVTSCSASFPSNEQVVLTPYPATGYVFQSWGGDCAAQESADNKCVLLMNSEKIVSVEFYVSAIPPPPPTKYTLSVFKNPDGGGTVESSDGWIRCGSACSYDYGSGTTVTLTAAPRSGYTFDSWNGCEPTASRDICTVYIDSNKNVTANFKSTAETLYTLTVTKNPVGGGSVTSNPSGISCGSVCSYSFASGTTVSLSYILSLGYSFSGWSGDCSGSTCSVYMNSNKSVTATFKDDRTAGCSSDADCSTHFCTTGFPRCNIFMGTCYCDFGSDM